MGFLQLEPSLVLGVLTAFVTLAIAFGAPITPDQKIAILGAGGALWALVKAVAVRQSVTPNKAITDAGLNPKTVAAQGKASRAQARQATP